MDQNYTHITFLLDESGSMQPLASDVKGSLNSFVNDQKGVPGKCTFSLVKFDTSYDVQFWGTNIQDVPNIEYQPRGGTALFQALERSIRETGDYLREMPENKRPAKVLFVIQTDGEENSSDEEFTLERVSEMVKHQTEVYSWDFVFMGANIDAFAAGNALSIGNSVLFQSTPDGYSNMTRTLSGKVAAYRVSDKSNIVFTEAEIDEIAKKS